ncbi:hypothetical protein GCM10010178_42460 [Lentzea flava]|uniref:Uncharacterized protein n=1 Tax=Lentzea flava TaxID=103732 RepID=A0ABQ2UNE2_9PSEU|nr:hypothetical protein [Lentzea flava]GGU45542.1 hypothetical protein GCM10010178_42460 [Lentzea flava]
MGKKQVYAISWLYVEELNISIRWHQANHFQEIFQGDHKGVNREALREIDRVPTPSTWVDNVDVYREANRYLKAEHPRWYRQHGPLGKTLAA